MEAYYLFGIEDILPILHRQSAIHSMVEYIDGSVKAQMAVADMRLPILYALTYPKRIKTDYLMDFSEIMNLTFEPMDFIRYPALKLAYDVLNKKGILPTVYNAANEIAVEMFLKSKIKFTDIYRIIEKTVASFENINNPSLDDIINFDIEARRIAKEVIV
jgi:1-deoxy-D-xylulose-5-phosphate reductoisomerase